MEEEKIETPKRIVLWVLCSTRSLHFLIDCPFLSLLCRRVVCVVSCASCMEFGFPKPPPLLDSLLSLFSLAFKSLYYMERQHSTPFTPLRLACLCMVTHGPVSNQTQQRTFVSRTDDTFLLAHGASRGCSVWETATAKCIARK